MLTRTRLLILIVLTLCLAIASCAGQSSQLPSPDQDRGSDAADTAPVEFGGIPALDSLSRDASELSAQRFRQGSEFLPSLSSGDNVSVNAKACNIMPMKADLWRLSYAGWRFWLPDFAAEPQLSVQLDPEKIPTEDSMYLGLSNWEHGSWSWFVLPADGTVSLGDMTPYIEDYSSLLYAVVLTDGTDELAVQQLRIGGSLPPTAMIRSDKYFAAPLDAITLDATQSEAFEGAIAKIEFDPEGNGNWIDTALVSTLLTSYSDSGLYMAGLRITDAQGNEGLAQVPISISDSAYHEQENNDGAESAHPIPADGFSGLTGNIGNAGPHGDGNDWFSFSVDKMSSLELEITFTGTDEYVFCDLSRYIEGGDPELLSHNSIKSHGFVTETLPPGRYLLELRDFKDSEVMDQDYEINVIMERSEPPVVVLDSYAFTTGYDKVLNLSIDNSYDPDGNIVLWEIDLFGDGYFEQNSILDGNFSFPAIKPEGSFSAVARVRDDSGLETEFEFPFTFVGSPVHNFAEAEPNDSIALGNPLPDFDFTKLQGNLNSKLDEADIYTFTIQEPGQVNLDLDVLNEGDGHMSMRLYRVEFGTNTLVESLNSGGDGSITTEADMAAGEYYIWLFPTFGSNIYHLSGSFTAAP